MTTMLAPSTTGNVTERLLAGSGEPRPPPPIGGAAFLAPFGRFAAVGALVLSAWLLSSTSRSNAWTTAIAGAVGLPLFYVFGARRRSAARATG